MPIDSTAAIAEIDSVLAEFETARKQHTRLSRTSFGQVVHDSDGTPFYELDMTNERFSHYITLLFNAISRVAINPDNLTRANAIYSQGSTGESRVTELAGILSAIKADYVAGRLRTATERLRSEMFTDFLEMAVYLLEDEGLKDPAAVLAGGVLEQHLRSLCAKHGIPTTFTNAKGDTVAKKSDVLNADLVKANAYDGTTGKQVVAWLGIRNDAAHTHYGKYDAARIQLMIDGIKYFISRNPA